MGLENMLIDQSSWFMKNSLLYENILLSESKLKKIEVCHI